MVDFLIVDDDFGSRGGMAQTLKDFYPGCLVHEARAVQSAIDLLDKNRSIALVLLDLNVDDSRGIETLKTLKLWCEEQDVNPRIVVVSGGADYDDTLIPKAIDECATGFITKGTREEVFRSAIDLTLAGSVFVPERYLRSRQGVPKPAPLVLANVSLKGRQAQIAPLLIKGLTYKQIARKLEQAKPGGSMSPNTVRVHVQDMAWKVGAANPGRYEGLAAKATVLTAIADQRLRLTDFGEQ